jgi:hypothetical protein
MISSADPALALDNGITSKMRRNKQTNFKTGFFPIPTSFRSVLVISQVGRFSSALVSLSFTIGLIIVK